MSKSYHYVKAMAQPDQTACWSTSMAWWTHAVTKVKNKSELDIMGMFNHLTGSDGGIKFPDGFETMLTDPLWGLKVEKIRNSLNFYTMSKKIFAKAPVMCAYWDINVNGYHAVALYNYKQDKGVWAMDPNGGIHILRDVDYYLMMGSKTMIGYLA